jgi:hypothetical protein
MAERETWILGSEHLGLMGKWRYLICFVCEKSKFTFLTNHVWKCLDLFWWMSFKIIRAHQPVDTVFTWPSPVAISEKFTLTDGCMISISVTWFNNHLCFHLPEYLPLITFSYHLRLYSVIRNNVFYNVRKSCFSCYFVDNAFLKEHAFV